MFVDTLLRIHAKKFTNRCARSFAYIIARREKLAKENNYLLLGQ